MLGKNGSILLREAVSNSARCRSKKYMSSGSTTEKTQGEEEARQLDCVRVAFDSLLEQLGFLIVRELLAETD